MNSLRSSFANPRMAAVFTGIYAVLLSYLLLTPEPLFLLGVVGGDVHDVVDATVSTYLQHSMAYAVLTTMLSWWTIARGEWAPRFCLLAAGSHALSTELLQTFIPQRYGEVLDVLADFAGMGAGMLLVAACPMLFRGMHRIFLPVDSAGSDA